MLLVEAVRIRIDELCQERNLTKYQLAKLSTIPRSAFTMMKTSNTIKLSTVSAICDGLEISLKDFFDSPLFDRETTEY